MKSHFARISAAFVLAALLTGCGPAEPKAAGAAAGTDGPGAAELVSSNTYRDPGLGLTITAPDGWYVAPMEQMSKMMDAGKTVTTAKMDPALKAAVEESVHRTANIFRFMQQPPGTPVDYIPAVMGVTEDISMLPGIKRGSDYLMQARRLMEASAVPTVVSDAVAERSIGGQSFDRMDVEMGPQGQSVKQRYYAARHGDNALIIIQSYRTDEDLATLDKVIDSIKLDW